MSDTFPNPASPTAEKRNRSPVERSVVWTLIGLLLLLVIVEFRAQQGYSKSVTAISAATTDNDNDLSMSDVESLIRMATSRELTAENGIETTHRYSWLSLFKSDEYLLNVVYAKDKESSILRWWTGAGPDPMTIFMPDPESVMPTGPMPDLVSGGGSDMGMNAASIGPPEGDGTPPASLSEPGDGSSSETAVPGGADVAPDAPTGDGESVDAPAPG